jgi:hypothetical protein
VSYPTIRLRLDRLIDRLHRLLEHQRIDPISELLAKLVERGEMTVSAARAVQEAYRRELAPEDE